MSVQCQVAKFVSEKIQMSGKSQKDVAEQAGFDKPNMITMIKQGRTKLPIAKIGPLAIALETDPVHLLKLCFSTYYPETWKAVAPFLVSALKCNDLRLLNALRAETGDPFLYALSEESKGHLDKLMRSLREPARIH